MVQGLRAGRQKPLRLSGRIYAVGDIHGRLDLLMAALARIREHAAGIQATTVFLGDYVDRGPESRGVVECLRSHSPTESVCLKGNHEAMMVAALRQRGSELSVWLERGGRATLHSYGVRDLSELWLVPSEHLVWLANLPLLARDEHRIYVHAGVRPGQGVERQKENTFLWIREQFLQGIPTEFSDHIVHGHTPEWASKPGASEPELLPHRTNLDTGAYYTGVLTIGVFDGCASGGPVEILSVVGSRAWGASQGKSGTAGSDSLMTQIMVND